MRIDSRIFVNEQSVLSVCHICKQLPFVVRVNMCQIDMWRRRREIECGMVGRPSSECTISNPVSTNRLATCDQDFARNADACIVQCVCSSSTCVMRIDYIF